MKKVEFTKPQKSLVSTSTFVETYGGDSCGGTACGYDM